MSTWYETEKEDINIDYQSKEIDLYVTDSQWGNIYKTLTFKQIEEIYEEITDGQQNKRSNSK